MFWNNHCFVAGTWRDEVSTENKAILKICWTFAIKFLTYWYNHRLKKCHFKDPNLTHFPESLTVHNVKQINDVRHYKYSPVGEAEQTFPRCSLSGPCEVIFRLAEKRPDSFEVSVPEGTSQREHKLPANTHRKCVSLWNAEIERT